MKVRQFVKAMTEDDDKDGSKLSFIASTDRADRYGDIIDQRGWELDSYRANPVILLNHDHQSLPIGRGDVRLTEAGLMIDVEFDMADPRAAEIAGKAERGFMNAVSVGFAPLKATPRAQLPSEHYAYSKSGGQFFEQAELLEVSIVTIPANADAVAIAAKNIGFDLKAYIKEQIQTEINAMPATTVSKHILNVIEDENTVTVVFAKHGEEMEMDGMKEEDEEKGSHKEDEDEKMSYHDDDSEEEKGSHKEEEDEEMKALIKALLSHRGDY
jgi:HK97 family phage prohead protease